jgi:hypothetical protein
MKQQDIDAIVALVRELNYLTETSLRNGQEIPGRIFDAMIADFRKAASETVSESAPCQK